MKATLTPYARGEVKQTGRRVFRKQVLPLDSITYKGRRINFTRDYLADLAAAFNDGAYDMVAFQLADATNTHTLDPERTRGEVKAFELTADGLDAVIELSDGAAELVKQYPRLGVSARIVEGLNRADGKTFPRAIQHVLGTIDQRIPDLRPWQEVELSNDDTTEVLDLTACSYQGGVMPKIDVTDEQLDVLRTVLSAAGAGEVSLANETAEQTATETAETKEEATAGASPADGTTTTETSTEDVSALTDEELEQILADAEQLAGATADLANTEETTTETVDLAEARQDATTARAETAQARFELARRDLLDAGVPPHAIDLAQPVLSTPEDTVIELANTDGANTDVRGIVAGLLDALKGTVDLSNETGRGHDDEPGKETDDLADRWSAFIENN